MASNGLSHRRDYFPRPAVCKAPQPTQCPYGLLIPTLIGYTSGAELRARFIVRLNIPAADGTEQITATYMTTNRQSGGPFGLPPNTDVLLESGVLATGEQFQITITATNAVNGCTYIGSTLVTVPLSPFP